MKKKKTNGLANSEKKSNEFTKQKNEIKPIVNKGCGCDCIAGKAN